LKAGMTTPAWRAFCMMSAVLCMGCRPFAV
jgi:hypothetical protein